MLNYVHSNNERDELQHTTVENISFPSVILNILSVHFPASCLSISPSFSSPILLLLNIIFCCLLFFNCLCIFFCLHCYFKILQSRTFAMIFELCYYICNCPQHHISNICFFFRKAVFTLQKNNAGIQTKKKTIIILRIKYMIILNQFISYYNVVVAWCR